jgi:hypothetical protein
MPKPDEWDDAEILAEEICGKDMPHESIEAAIAVLQTRVERLQADHCRVSAYEESAAKDSSLLRSEREIMQAKARIRNYRAQLKARN